MSSLKDIRNRAICINDYLEEIMDAYAELWDDYLDASQERDELAERVKELESENETKN